MRLLSNFPYQTDTQPPASYERQEEYEQTNDC